jgi:hypothetical protein
MERRPGKQRRIAVRFSSLSPVGVDSPPVPDDQNNWLRHTAQIRPKYPASNGAFQSHGGRVTVYQRLASALSAAFLRRR